MQRLKARAERRHRSLQGELMAIIEEAVRSSETLAPDDVLKEVRRLKLTTPRESAAIVRADRDGR